MITGIESQHFDKIEPQTGVIVALITGILKSREGENFMQSRQAASLLTISDILGMDRVFAKTLIMDYFIQPILQLTCRINWLKKTIISKTPKPAPQTESASFSHKIEMSVEVLRSGFKGLF